MQFQLPVNLRQEVIKYDPTLKKLETETTKTQRKKPAYPLGNVINLGLIPEDIVKLSDQQLAIDNINQAPADSRFYFFKQVTGEPLAVIYHTKHFWVAVWMPRKKDDEEYWYGISVAFKDNATARKQFTGRLFHNGTYGAGSAALIPDISHMRSVRIGRTDWAVTTQFITQDHINDGYIRSYYFDCDGNHGIESYKDRTGNIRRVVNKFDEELKKRIPVWYDTRYNHSVWSRTTPKGNTIKYCLQQMRQSLVGCDEDQQNKIEFQHTSDWYIQRFINTRFYPHISRDLLKSKWFRNKVNMMCTKTSAAFNSADPIRASVKPICQPVAELLHFVESADHLYRLYPDINDDLVKSRYDLLVETEFRVNQKNLALLWIQNNLNHDSFWNMLAKFHEYKQREAEDETDDYRRNWNMHDWTGLYSFFWRDFDDILSMLNQVLTYNNTKQDASIQLNPQPKRWRFQEWHDHLMAETWKIQTPNHDLPQKLFPQPISTDGHTFFQPIDTHQLAHWGRAAHNCVGSSNYVEGIKKYKFMIVLCMIGGKPRYTVQLKVDNGMMHVSQIADVGNKRLDDQERSAVEQAFSAALQQRESQLG
jgi:hypothetical protein